MEEKLHALNRCAEPPARFTYPFCYEPHPLCVEAARMVEGYVETSGLLDKEPGGGKMFGVLVVADPSCEDGHLFFLAAYSGLLAGRNDWSYFVPPVFDAQQPSGHFKVEEKRISALNDEIKTLENDVERLSLLSEKASLEAEFSSCIALLKQQSRQAKAIRDARRQSGEAIGEAEQAAMTRQSQFMKAEIARAKKAYSLRQQALDGRLNDFNQRIASIKQRRKTMSDDLQMWLFGQYTMLNAKGQTRNICQIFNDSGRAIPPAGAGDCCAPKLLQYAYKHDLKPLCMAEFWLGCSPKSEIRHAGHYYPACRGKCFPILGFMLQGLDVDPDPLEKDNGHNIEIVYEDNHIAVIAKPSGLLSVPGRSQRESVWSILRRRWPEAAGPIIVHRLDMDTSGLMVVAKTNEAYADLQRQFAARSVEKEYIAVVEGIPSVPRKGMISLPLRPDHLDRPRQVVDVANGKEAVTEYEIIGSNSRYSLVVLHPRTGRTHQLRTHCSHVGGLACPIVGDALYGRSGGRLMLHACKITFAMPFSSGRVTFDAPPEPLFYEMTNQN